MASYRKTIPVLLPSTRSGFVGRGDAAANPPLCHSTWNPVHTAYTRDLAAAPVSTETRRNYTSKVRGFLAWLADADLNGDPSPTP